VCVRNSRTQNSYNFRLRYWLTFVYFSNYYNGLWEKDLFQNTNCLYSTNFVPVPSDADLLCWNTWHCCVSVVLQQLTAITRRHIAFLNRYRHQETYFWTAGHCGVQINFQMWNARTACYKLWVCFLRLDYSFS